MIDNELDPSGNKNGNQRTPTALSEPANERTNLLRRAHDHLAAHDTEAAKSLIETGIRRWPDDGSWRMLAARLAEAEGRSTTAIELFRQAAVSLRQEVEASPKDGERALALAQALIQSGDANGAEAALGLARERGIDSARQLRTERWLAWSRKDWPTMRRAAENLTASEATLTARDFTALAEACRNLNDYKGTAKAAERALELDATLFDAGMMAAWAAMQEGDGEKAISRFRQLSELMPDNPRLAYYIIRLLVLTGKVSEASTNLDAALLRWPKDPSLRMFALICGFRSVEEIAPISQKNVEADPFASRERQLRRVVELAPRSSEWQREIITDDKSSDVIIGEAPGADTAVLVFTALNDVVSMPLAVFDRYMAALGVTTIYVKDFQRLNFLKGIMTLGRDYANTLAALQGICRGLGVRRLCTLGYSSGGAAAVRYGIELGADRIVSFGGRTHAAHSALADLNSGHIMVERHRANRLEREERDFKKFLLSRPHSSKVAWVYSEGLVTDKAQALYLADVDCVTLYPIARCNQHELPVWLAIHDDLRGMLATMLGVRSGTVNGEA